MDVLGNPVVYLSLAILFIVAFFQIKQAVEAFMGRMNLTDPSGNMVVLDQSGNIVKFDAMGSPVPPTSDDISSFFRRAFGSFTAFQSSAAAPETGMTNTSIETKMAATVPEEVSTVPKEDSIEKSEEKQKALADSIATQIKDKLLVDRATTPMAPAQVVPYSPSECLYQGQEYSTAQPSKAFDSNEYIRKDSIPCWGCTLPA